MQDEKCNGERERTLLDVREIYITPPFPFLHTQFVKLIPDRVNGWEVIGSSKIEPFPMFRTIPLTFVSIQVEKIPEYARLKRGVLVSVASKDSLPDIVMCVRVMLPSEEMLTSEHPLPNVVTITILKLEISNEPVDIVNTDDVELNSDVIVRIALLSSSCVVFMSTSLSPISIALLSFV